MAPSRKKQWPQNQDFNEAVQIPRTCFNDKTLQRAELVLKRNGLPVVASGSFADVYRLRDPATNRNWAVKCFTAPVRHHHGERYRAVGDCLKTASLPYTVAFEYCDKGMLVRGDWYPILKWSGEGLSPISSSKSHFTTHLFAGATDRWVDMATRLRQAHVAHGDLQHGNVFIIPHQKRSLEIRLVDYDGMFVPALADTDPDESGHPAYQHPARGKDPRHRIEVDYFSHLVIACAIRALIVTGRPLWNRYNKGENLLFRKNDFLSPQDSAVFRELWDSNDGLTKLLSASLILSCDRPFGSEPFLPEIINSASKASVCPADAEAVEEILSRQRLVQTTEPRTKPKQSARTVENTPASQSPATKTASHPSAKPSSIRRTSPRRMSAPPIVNARGAILAIVIVVAFLVLARRLIFGPITPAEPSPAMQMTLIPAGEFLMNSTEKGASKDEAYVSRVSFESPFYLGTFEVTREQFEIVMGFERSDFPTGREYREEWRDLDLREFPVENVELLEAFEFCNRLSLRIGREPFYKRSPDGSHVVLADTDGVRLPTEAEWEYACRGNSTTPFHFGESIDTNVANISLNGFGRGQLSRPTTVGSYKPNSFGLYDMHGNVSEWCLGERFPQSSPTSIDLTRHSALFCVRGGSWRDIPASSTARGTTNATPSERFYDKGCVGFRIMLPQGKSTDGGSLTIPLNPAEETMSTGINEFQPDTPLPITMQLIPAGTFIMGSHDSEGDYKQFERPRHSVRITVPFYMGTHEVTRHQYDIVMNADSPIRHTAGPGMAALVDTSNFPVSDVSWYNAVAFCNALSKKEGLAPYYSISESDKNQSPEVSALGGTGYRLPSEAEWEYACRAGTETTFHSGAKLSIRDANIRQLDALGKVDAFCKDNDDSLPDVRGATRVGSFTPNAFGLCDMHGSVSEWCGDWYDNSYYSHFVAREAIDPTGPRSIPYDIQIGKCRVCRGGSYWHSAEDARAAHRSFAQPDSQLMTQGFRLARSVR